MDISEIIKYRLVNQQLAQQAFTDAGAAVAWMGAVQAQDYGAAKWALGQRVGNATDAAIEKAFAAGKILRTHLMRPTWHFVAPADIRWLLLLTAPRVIVLCGGAYRMLELDDAIFNRSRKALEQALQGGRQLTRTDIAAVLQKAKVNTDDLRFTHLMMRAELDGIICSGARQGKQFTYALLDERVPQKNTLTNDEALAALTKRYFMSHGPATLQDFVWWSGLTMTTAKEGMELCRSIFMNEVVGEQTYWFSHSLPAINNMPDKAYLLPNYDEYVVGYKDRSMLVKTAHLKRVSARGNVLFNNIIVINGQVAGIWKRTLKKKEAIIDITPFTPLSKAHGKAVAAAVQQYKAFIKDSDN